MELRARHMHENPVITAFEIDVLVPFQACVDDRHETVGGTDRRDRAVFAVREESARLFLRGQGNRPL